MRILIGDSLFNQRFLAVAARRAGFREIAGAATGEDLIAAASGADVVAFDPGIHCAGYGLDVALGVLQVVPRTRLIVLSSRTADLERAELNGIAAARKWSIFQLGPLSDALALVKDSLVCERSGERPAAPTPPPAEPCVAIARWEPTSSGPSASASVLAASVAST